jgi:hypothetical protein
MSMLYWHFLRYDRRMQFAPWTLVEAGKTYTAVGELGLCENGLHASFRAMDALKYAPGCIVCRVSLSGERQVDSDKVCARSRTVLWLADAGLTLHEFACLLAEQTLVRAAAAGHKTDPRSLAAVAAKRAWLRQEISDEALDEAREAAWAAARATYRGTEAAIAEAAARNAARNSARSAAWTIAGAVHGVLGHSEINADLERLLLALAPAEGTPA